MKGLPTLVTLVLTLSIAPLAAQGAVINVPDPGSGITTIQDGIDAASPGDEVVVAPGDYDAITIDKEVTVRSELGAESTSINGAFGTGPVQFEFVGPGAVLRGFTVTGGGMASGISLDNASPVIEENTITGNVVLGRGGAIGGSDSSPIIRENKIRGNSASNFGYSGNPGGGGIALSGDGITPQIYNNFIQNNHASCSGTGFCISAVGGGISVDGGSPRIIGNVMTGNGLDANVEGGGALELGNTVDAVVANNTIYDNEAETQEFPIYEERGGAVFLASSNEDLLFANNIVQASSGIGVRCDDGFTGQIHGTNALYDNPEGDFVDCPTGSGDLFVDPPMVDPAGGDYHLAETSPLIDAGTAGVPGLPATDVYGEARILDGDGNSTAELDIGAAEYAPAPAWELGATEAQASVTVSRDREASRAFNFLAILALPALAVAAWRRRRRFQQSSPLKKVLLEAVDKWSSGPLSAASQGEGHETVIRTPDARAHTGTRPTAGPRRGDQGAGPGERDLHPPGRDRRGIARRRGGRGPGLLRPRHDRQGDHPAEPVRG